jgi:hypothetical protein
MSLFVIAQSRRITLHSAALAGIAVLLVGCGDKSASRRLQQAYLDNPKVAKASIAPFEGYVTVDGAPPGKDGSVLLVILNDPNHPQDPHRRPKLVAGCTADGHFDFTTFDAHDGVECGSYIVTFVQLKNLAAPFGKNKKAGYGPPDELKNLYNDPEKNADVPEFHVEVKPPGLKDVHFDLTVAGKEPVEQPGAHAITAIDTR